MAISPDPHSEKVIYDLSFQRYSEERRSAALKKLLLLNKSFKLKLKSYETFALVTTVFVIVYTYFLGELFVGGDQTTYRSVYSKVQELDLISAYAHYRSKIYSDEIGHFVIIWLVSPWIDKDIFNAISNALLAFFSYRLFAIWRAHPAIAFILVSFGYYFLAVYLSAERLKYAALLYVLGLNLYYSKSWRLFSIPFFILSLITHLQFLILVAAYSSVKASSILASLIRRLSINKKDFVSISLATLAVISLFGIFHSHLINKITGYHSDFGIEEYLKTFVFFIFSLVYAKEKTSVFSAFLVLFLAVAAVGDMRVNIFSYFVFIYFSLPVKRGFNLGVAIFFIYFLIGWFEYSFNVFNCGVNRPC